MGFVKDYVGKKVDMIGAAASSISSGLALGQFPQYIAQYVQRLGGHIDEARYASQEFNVPELAERASRLQHGLEAITTSSSFGKLFAFIQHVDIGIAKKVLSAYTPGMAMDTEGLMYCGAGALTGLGLYEVGKFGVAVAKNRIKKKKDQ
ncbi:DUF2937 family protein [Candidatus Woesearchaeota archaeon]|nr:DUF2937 family protein [Candidatus Woesearchaeota archaeon]